MQGFVVESIRNGLGIQIRSRDNVGDVAVLRAGRCGVRILRVTRFPPQKKKYSQAGGCWGLFPLG